MKKKKNKNKKRRKRNKERGEAVVLFLKFQEIVIFSHKNYIAIYDKYFLDIAYLCDSPKTKHRI